GGLLRDPRRLFGVASAATAAAGAAGLLLLLGGGWAARFPSEIVALDRERQPEIPFLECMNRRAGADEPVCHIGARDAHPSVLVWGDSHALAWAPALDAVLQDR